MHSRSVRTGRFAVILVVIALLGASLPRVGAQSNELSGINGNSWTSPTFGYTATWDDQVWQVLLEYSSLTFDYLALESSGATAHIELLYSYQGDAEICMRLEQHRIAQDRGLTELAPLSSASGAASEASGEDWSQGFYALPISDQDGTVAEIVYLECRSVVPGSVVMILTGYLDPADGAAQQDAILNISAEFGPGPSEVPPLDLIAFENQMWQTTDNVDAFWADVFADRGIDYRAPNYQLVTFPIQLEDCGLGPTEETGPMYCALEETIYLDMDQLQDFLYQIGQSEIDLLIGHEVGHHVQTTLQLNDIVDGVENESQAECLAGAWLGHALSSGFLDERAEYRIIAGAKSGRELRGEANSDYASGEELRDMIMAGYEGGVTACGIE